MNFDDLVKTFGELPIFSRADLSLLCDESDMALGVSLHRLKQSGKILELKRGLYAFADPWRKATLHAPLVANLIYSPSYLSGFWALSWYGVIPEKVDLYSSVTTRSTRSFENSFGRFSYRSLKPALFAGWEKTLVSGVEVLIATPEKALADHFYLESGEWNEGRMESMRFDCDDIDAEKLEAFLGAAGESRLDRAMRAWRRYTAVQAKGMVVV